MKPLAALSATICALCCQTALSGTAWRVDGQISSPPGGYSDSYAITHCAAGGGPEPALWIPNQYGEADGGLACEIAKAIPNDEGAYAVDVVCTGVGGFAMTGSGIIAVSGDALDGRIELGAAGASADMRVRHEWVAQSVGGCD